MIPVVLDTQVFLMQKTGGASVYWFEMLDRMMKDPDIDLHLLLADTSYSNVQLERLDLSNCHIHREPYKSMSRYRLSDPVIPSIVAGKAIFHSSYLRAPKRKSDFVRTVVTVYDFTHQKYFPLSHRIPNSFLKKRAVTRADGIICISESTRRDLLGFYPDANSKRTTVIYNGAGVHYKPLDGSGSVGMEGTQLSTVRKPYILYVGAKEGYKNFSFVLDLMSKLDNFDLVVVGGAKPMTCDHPDGFSIVETGIVDDAALNKLYNNAHCLVYPSLYEGFGIPVLEGMKAGCPVVAFNNSSIPEVLNGSGILLEDNDLSGCVKAVEALRDADYRASTIKEQLAASRIFSWDATYKEVKAFYEDLLHAAQ